MSTHKFKLGQAVEFRPCLTRNHKAPPARGRFGGASSEEYDAKGSRPEAFVIRKLGAEQLHCFYEATAAPRRGAQVGTAP
jgi:hypothetical protein